MRFLFRVAQDREGEEQQRPERSERSRAEEEKAASRRQSRSGGRGRGSERARMPCLNVSTNVNLEGVDTSAILAEASKSVADIIGKPEAYVMVVLKGSVPMAFGGTQEPAAYGELVSIGGLNPNVNKKLSAGIASILESKLSVPKSRFYLKFNDSKGSDFGWNGSTF
ncbi:uncharacterized protein [Miscanthus floridulus]